MSPLGYSWAVKGIRSTRGVFRYPKALHPIALRKMGYTVPSVEPMSPPSYPVYTPFTPPVWDHDDYSPTSPCTAK